MLLLQCVIKAGKAAVIEFGMAINYQKMTNFFKIKYF